MFLTEGSVKDVIVAAIQAAAHRDNVANVIKETVDALVAADLVLHAHAIEQERVTFEAR